MWTLEEKERRKKKNKRDIFSSPSKENPVIHLFFKEKWQGGTATQKTPINQQHNERTQPNNIDNIFVSEQC